MNPAALILGDTAMALPRNHPALLRAALRTLATAFLFDGIATGGLGLAQSRLKFFAQFPPGYLTIRRLRTFALHPHFHPGRPVAKTDRRRSFIDFLTSRTRSAHKFFFHVGRNDAQRIESPLDLRWKIHLVRSFFLGKLFR